MKNYILGIALLLFIAPNMSDANNGYGYLEKVENNHPTATLYLKSTDPIHGQYNDGTEHESSIEAIIPPGKSILHFNNYLIPGYDGGGKIYVWLKDPQGNIINAATIQDKDYYIIFSGDNELHQPNSLYIKDFAIENVFANQCIRKSDADPLVCQWRRDGTNQQYTLLIDSQGTMILTRYSETEYHKKCSWDDAKCNFQTVGSFFKNTGNKIGDAFKTFGNDLKNGFNKVDSCTQVATLGTQLAAKMAAKETILSGNLTDAILDGAQSSAIAPLIAAREGAQQVLEAAKKILDASNKAATASIDAANQAADATLKGGQSASIAVLTAADKTANAIVDNLLKNFNIQQVRYEGSLQKLASGNLGNVQCIAFLAGRNFDFNFNLSIKEPINGIEILSKKIADKFVILAKQIASKTVDIAHQAAGILHVQTKKLHDQEDLIKLTVWHYSKKHMPLNIALTEELL